jgi:hypothetical protein
VTAPRFNILTQQELTIDLSRPAMQFLLAYILNGQDVTTQVPDDAVQCELDNFRNILQNLIERSEPKPENFDLIGE